MKSKGLLIAGIIAFVAIVGILVFVDFNKDKIQEPIKTTTTTQQEQQASQNQGVNQGQPPTGRVMPSGQPPRPSGPMPSGPRPSGPPPQQQ